MNSLLYHGTSERFIKEILRDGIKPRSISGNKGNWKHTVQSNPKAVYLTNAYPIYFAAEAAKTNERWAIIEVRLNSLNKNRLHPDEDVLEQIGRKLKGLPEDLPVTWSLKRRILHYRHIAEFNPNWEASLEAMGTCAYYGTVPPEAISRIALFDSQKYPAAFVLSLIDASICLANYKFCGAKYKALTRWILGETSSVSDIDEFSGKDFGLDPKWVEERRQVLADILANRSGIEIMQGM